jgi:hypothetical protein
MFKMGKERLLTTMFQSITSEKRKTKLILNEQVIQKQSVGKVRKVVVVILFPQQIKREDEEPTKEGKQQKRRGLSPAKNDGKHSKKRGSYTNWLQLKNMVTTTSIHHLTSLNKDVTWLIK